MRKIIATALVGLAITGCTTKIERTRSDGIAGAVDQVVAGTTSTKEK